MRVTGSDEAEASGLAGGALSPVQSRAARGLLDWSVMTLATRVGLDERVVRDFEQGNRDPGGGQLEALRSALMAAGVIFLDGDEPGVRLTRRGGDEGTRLETRRTTENDR